MTALDSACPPTALSLWRRRLHVPVAGRPRRLTEVWKPKAFGCAWDRLVVLASSSPEVWGGSVGLTNSAPAEATSRRLLGGTRRGIDAPIGMGCCPAAAAYRLSDW